MSKTLPVLLCLPLLAGGCAYHGPEALSMTRPEYNVVIQQTNDQELLLNLVRLKYRDTPYFLGGGEGGLQPGVQPRPVGQRLAAREQRR